MNEKLDYESMSTEELIKLYKEEEELATISDLRQHAMKILLNSLYGSCGTVYFLYYNLYIAEGITLQGQCYIKKSSREAVNYICENLGIDYDDKMICAGDTDSVTGDTNIYIAHELEPMECEMFGVPEGTVFTGAKNVEQLFEESGEDYLTKNDDLKAYVKLPRKIRFGYILPPGAWLTDPKTGEMLNKRSPTIPFYIWGVNKYGELERSELKYVMKHRVKKNMYKLTVGNKTVTMTEDHSLMVERDGEIIDIKPYEIQSTDKIVSIKNIEHLVQVN